MPDFTTGARPILFQSAMARAVHHDLKTQTRRLVKADVHKLPESWRFDDDLRHFGTRQQYQKDKSGGVRVRCPHGVPGARLFVRESIGYTVDSRGKVVLVYAGGDDQAFYVLAEDNGEGDYVALGEQTDRSRCSPVEVWKPSIHMPRWACRTVVELTEVRAERVESISEEDAIAEGYPTHRGVPGDREVGPIEWFLNLFYDINKRAPCGSNPWVWVLGLKRVEVPRE